MRPKPIVLASNIDKKSHKILEALKSDGIYAVFYDGKPINLRHRNAYTDGGPKYQKSAFHCVGSAWARARKLNKQFNTDKFSVFKLGCAEPISDPKAV